jgi:hypothetical protein
VIPPLFDGRHVSVGPCHAIRGRSANAVERMVPRRMIGADVPTTGVFDTLVESRSTSIDPVSGELFEPFPPRIDMVADIVVLGRHRLVADDVRTVRRSHSRIEACSPARACPPTRPRIRWWIGGRCPTWPSPWRSGSL